MSVPDSPVVTMLNSAVFVAAAVLAAAGWAGWVVTFTPWARLMPSGFSIPFFFLVFPVFGWSVYLLTAGRRREPRGRWRTDLVQTLPRGPRRTNLLAAFPRRARIPLGAAFVAVWATSLDAMSALPGQPGYDPKRHRYFYDEHGVIVPATRDAYLHAVAVQNRLFLGVAMVFTSIAVVVTYQERARRRRDLSVPDRWLRPVRPRPKVPVPAAVLALAAAVALGGTVTCATLIIGRVDAYNGHAIYLRAGHPVRVLLARDDYVVFVGCTQAMACPPLEPAALSVRSVQAGAAAVVPDPSSDHLSEGAQPFVGQLSFIVPRTEVVQIGLATDPGQPVFVVPSEGGHQTRLSPPTRASAAGSGSRCSCTSARSSSARPHPEASGASRARPGSAVSRTKAARNRRPARRRRAPSCSGCSAPGAGRC